MLHKLPALCRAAARQISRYLGLAMKLHADQAYRHGADFASAPLFHAVYFYLFMSRLTPLLLMRYEIETAASMRFPIIDAD